MAEGQLFDFDEFDRKIEEALEENEEAMAEVFPLRKPRPGEIGGVACRPTLFDLPPDDAA